MGQLHYDTVSTAIDALRREGYTVDFRLEENRMVCPTDRFSYDEFDIVVVA